MSIEDRDQYEVLKALSEDDMQCLLAAGIVGVADLGDELVRLSLSDEQDRQQNAIWARGIIVRAVDVVTNELAGGSSASEQQ